MAAIKIKFDQNHNPLVPTFILGDKMGNKYGIIENAVNINVSDKMNDCPEISFTVYKNNNGKTCNLWDKLKNLMTVYCPEWDTWFEMGMDLSDDADILKNIALTRLGEAELSQIRLYLLEANTEDDIEFKEDEDKNTILYDPENKSYSLLDRILSKTPHYSIAHVDETIANLQREFSFDKVAIRDAFNEISEEINCLFVYNTGDGTGSLVRTISVYDLENNCKECGYRGEFTDKCPKCESTDIIYGYGKDTNIFVSSDGLGNNVKLEVDKDSIKNCFRLEAGDEIITAAVKMCSPTNSLYIWNWSDEQKELMPKELVVKLDDYQVLQDEYNNKTYSLDETMVKNYNDLIVKYSEYIDENYKQTEKDISGYANLIDLYYNTIDMESFLNSELMPTVEVEDTTIDDQIAIVSSIKKVSVESISTAMAGSVKSVVQSYAKVLVDGRYEVKINDGYSYDRNSHKFTCTFTVTHLSDEEVTKTSSNVIISIDENIIDFAKQKIEQLLNTDAYDTSITWLFNLEKCNLERFKEELTKYGLNSLTSFEESCNACMDLMIKMGINDNKESDEYKELSKPYLDRLEAIRTEINIREQEIDKVLSMQEHIELIISDVQTALDMTNFMGDLYPILCSYIREEEYENSNYISDGLNNTEIIEKAKEFLLKAEKELYKASSLQHKISADVKNLLVIKEFEPLVEQFECGNWIRVRADDEIFKLRLLEYDINYDDNSLNVVFSDVSKVFDGITDLKSVIEQASSMAGSYESYKSQVDKAVDKTKYIDGWISEGIDITNVSLLHNSYNQNITWDKNGLLCRELNYATGEYSKEQLKIIANGLYLTDNAWETSRAGIGKIKYYNPITKTDETKYGIVADTIIGNLVLSETVGIYNKANNITLDKDGFIIKGANGITVAINPNEVSVFTIKNADGNNVISMTEDGSLTIVGKIQALAGSDIAQGITGLSDVAFSGKYDHLEGKPDLSKYLTSNDMAIYISKDGVVGSTPSSGVTGFKVSKSGLLEASNAIIYGTIYASYGKIGNWTLADGYLSNSTTASDGSVYTTVVSPSSNLSTGTCFMVKKVTSSGSTTYPFFVRPSGHLHAEDVQISGEVIASTGKIGGFTISGQKTASNGFWNWALSSIVNTNASTVSTTYPQYAVFMRGQSDDGKSGAITPENVVFGVKKRTATSTTWNDASYMFYVKANGVVQCTDITTTGDVVIYDKLYMLNNGGEKCEVLSFQKGSYETLSIGTGCDGLYFKSQNKVLGEVWHLSNNTEWTFNGEIIVKKNARIDGFVEAFDGGIFGADIEIAGTVDSWNVKSEQYSLTDQYNNISKSAIRYVSGTSDGLGMSIGAGGLVVVGSGESADSFISEETKSGQTEQLCLTSDTNIYIVTNCKEIAERKQLVFTDTSIFRPTETGKWSVGSSTYKFNNGYFNNVYNSSGAITSSDERIKKDFAEIPNPEEFIMSLKPIQYKYIDGTSNRNHWGFRAQNVKESLDNICNIDCGLYIEDTLNSKPLSECSYEEKELGLRYEEFIAPHIFVTQKHNNEIKELKEEIKELKEIIKILTEGSC
jgi:hypothetical protein